MSELNLDHDAARALHRIVRAMHDGECPRCHRLYSAELMVETYYQVHQSAGDSYSCKGHRCLSCAFEISDAESSAVMKIFGPFMEKNLAIFEAWRKDRTGGAVRPSHNSTR